MLARRLLRQRRPSGQLNHLRAFAVSCAHNAPAIQDAAAELRTRNIGIIAHIDAVCIVLNI